MTDNVSRPVFGARNAVRIGADGKPVSPAGVTPPEAMPLEPEFTTPEWETWWLPEPVGEWVEACHLAFGVPKVMAIAAALCAAATVAQGVASVEVRPGWREPLSLYWLVFSPTGSRKSALLKAATAPIRALQSAKARDLEQDIRHATNEKARLEQQIARMRRQVKAHKYSEGAQEHLQQLRELEHEFAELVVPLPPRWLYDDINPTMVPRKLKYSQDAEGIARMAVLDAEGTFLANLLGRHSGHVNVDPLLKGYNGEPIDMVRAVHGSRETQDIHLEAAHLTLLLMVQPHYLDQIRERPELGTNGLIGRCLMSHLNHSATPQPWDAPAVPDAVQEGYARWLATLAALPPETVWQMPQSVSAELKAMHDQLEADRCAGQGAVGWTVRTLGRICRIVALTELAMSQPNSPVSRSPNEGPQHDSRLSQLSHGRTVVGGAARTRVISKLTYLYNCLYSQPLSTARALEPVTDPLARLTRRALPWLRQWIERDSATVTLRKVQNGLHLKKEAALALCDSLVESGHLEQLPPVQRANRTLTVTYRIISTEPNGTQTPPKPFLAQLPVGEELEPEDEGPPPESESYLGADDFDPFDP